MADSKSDAPNEDAPAGPLERVRNFFERQLYNTLRRGIRVAAKIYGVNGTGLEHFKALEGKPYVITPNHLSMFDAIVLAAMLPVEPAIAIDTKQYEKFMSHWWSRPLMKQVNLFPIDAENPYSLKPLTRLVQSGKPVLIFPEGRLTDDTTLSAIMAGASTVVMNGKVPFLPVFLDGLQRLPIGTRTPGPHRWLPKIRVMVEPPRTIDVPDDVTGPKRREAGRRVLEKAMQELPVLALDKDKSLIDALHEAAANYGINRHILEGLEADNVSYKTLLQKSYGLGAKIAEITKKGESVGVLLPTSIGAVATLFGINAFGRVFAPLNVASETPELVSNSETADMKTILTSRAMIEKLSEKAADKAKIDEKMAALGAKCKIVYLEDLRDSVGFSDKITAGLRARGLFRPDDRPKGQDHALTIFTSGSTGAPKGCAHSSYSLLANVEQVHAIAPIEPDQKVFNAMPIFHSFGLTGGVLMPIMNGMPSYQFPSPLRGREIPPLIYHTKAKIMFGTDTFLDLYARSLREKYKEKYFSRLEMIFAGAEPVREKTRETYFKRFGKTIYEGYGRSEEAPVVAINVPGANTNGTLGRLLPGIEARYEDVEGFPDGKKLVVKGPNQMLGYILHDDPGVIKPLPGGWDDTEDIVTVDSEGYLTFVDRAGDVAKIGGEKVPMSNVRKAAALASQKPNAEHATLQGDNTIVLFTNDPDLRGSAIAKAAQQLKLPALGMPKNQDIHYMKELPHKGIKVDKMKLKEIFKEMAAQSKPAPETAEPDTDLAADNGELPPPVVPDNGPRPAGP